MQPLQTVSGVAPPPGGVTHQGTVTRSRFHWSQAILAVGLLAISGVGTVVVIKVTFVLLDILQGPNVLCPYVLILLFEDFWYLNAELLTEF